MFLQLSEGLLESYIGRRLEKMASDLKSKQDYKVYFSRLWVKNPSKFWSEAKRLKIKKNISNLLPGYDTLAADSPLKNFPEGAFGCTRITPNKKD